MSSTSKNKLVELVNLWDKYDHDGEEMTIHDFCVKYLSEFHQKEEHESDNYGMPVQSQMAGLLLRMGKFATHYCKKALKDSALNNTEDWFYLIGLIDGRTPKKSEYIHEMLSEFPSGIEVINRLLKLGMLEEIQDPTDKRSKRIKITQTGLALLYATLPKMNKIGDMAFDRLDTIEKSILLDLLKKLETHHNKHYREVKELGFEGAYGVLIGSEET
jgi:MarR family transcriptional regulator, lower aerobic nicotinate degradation pathway regulator